MSAKKYPPGVRALEALFCFDRLRRRISEKLTTNATRTRFKTIRFLWVRGFLTFKDAHPIFENSFGVSFWEVEITPKGRDALLEAWAIELAEEDARIETRAGLAPGSIARWAARVGARTHAKQARKDPTK